MTQPRERHYVDVMGRVLSGVATIFEMNEDFDKLFMDMRERISRERKDGLPRVTKELNLLYGCFLVLGVSSLTSISFDLVDGLEPIWVARMSEHVHRL